MSKLDREWSAYCQGRADAEEDAVVRILATMRSYRILEGEEEVETTNKPLSSYEDEPRIVVQYKCTTHGLYSAHAGCELPPETVLNLDVFVGPISGYTFITNPIYEGNDLWVTPREVLKAISMDQD